MLLPSPALNPVDSYGTRSAGPNQMIDRLIQFE
jgi:hypothetical protein